MSGNVSIDLSFITCKSSREYIEDAINAMNITEGAWEWMKEYNPPEDKGFSWSTCNMQNKVCNAMIYYNHHSGCSMAFTLRALQAIAKNKDEWIQNYKENQ